MLMMAQSLTKARMVVPQNIFGRLATRSKDKVTSINNNKIGPISDDL